MKWGGDLVVLAADKNAEATLQGILSRREALQIRPLRWQVFVHIQSDPGCLLRSHDFLRSMTKSFAHGLVMFDRHGCGQEDKTREELEEEVEENLAASGWDDRAAAIVLDPELENWVWSDSPNVDECLGWRGKQPDLRSWLRGTPEWPGSSAKPPAPKEATELALRHVRKPRSSSIYKRLACSVSLERCSDPAFLKLKTKLREWFSEVT